MFDVWIYVLDDGRTGHPDWVVGDIFCPHTKNSVYLTEDLYAKLNLLAAFDPEHVSDHVGAIWSEAISWWRNYNASVEPRQADQPVA